MILVHLHRTTQIGYVLDITRFTRWTYHNKRSSGVCLLSSAHII